MKNVIITGANGFIGSAVCKELAEANVNVTAIVRSKKSDISRIEHLHNIKIQYCDMSEILQLSKKMPIGYDAFYHFAWEGSSGIMRGDVEKQLRNVQYVCDAVKISKALSCKKFIFASSIMEYEVDKLIRAEKCPSINMIYCIAKKTADYMAHAVAGDLGIEYISGMISNIFGPKEHSQRLINSSIRKLLKNEPTEFSEGNQLYDFVYISDAAKLFKAIGEMGKGDKIYYIGSGKPRPLKEFLFEMGEVVAPNIELGFGKLPYNGVSLTYQEFNMNELERDTGARAKVSFADGIIKTAEWIKGEMLNERI